MDHFQVLRLGPHNCQCKSIVLILRGIRNSPQWPVFSSWWWVCSRASAGQLPLDGALQEIQSHISAPSDMAISVSTLRAGRPSLGTEKSCHTRVFPVWCCSYGSLGCHTYLTRELVDPHLKDGAAVNPQQ